MSLQTPLTKDAICDSEDWCLKDGRSFPTMDVDDVRSAVEGLQCVRYFFVEDGRVCGRCNKVRFTWAIPNKPLPQEGVHELEMCAFCWNNYWFPVFVEDSHSHSIPIGRQVTSPHSDVVETSPPLCLETNEKMGAATVSVAKCSSVYEDNDMIVNCELTDGHSGEHRVNGPLGFHWKDSHSQKSRVLAHTANVDVGAATVSVANSHSHIPEARQPAVSLVSEIGEKVAGEMTAPPLSGVSDGSEQTSTLEGRQQSMATCCRQQSEGSSPSPSISLSQPTEEFRKASISVTGGSGDARELSRHVQQDRSNVKHAPRNGSFDDCTHEEWRDDDGDTDGERCCNCGVWRSYKRCAGCKAHDPFCNINCGCECHKDTQNNHYTKVNK